MRQALPLIALIVSPSNDIYALPTNLVICHKGTPKTRKTREGRKSRFFVSLLFLPYLPPLPYLTRGSRLMGKE